MKCPVCDESIRLGKTRIQAVLEHFRPFTLEHWKFWIGTYKHFGLVAVIALASPVFNTLYFWKYRKSRLTSQFNTLDDL